MSYTVTARTTFYWTNDVSGKTEEFAFNYALASVDVSKVQGGSSDTTGFDTLYDASAQNPDPGDAPFAFAIQVTSADGALLKITDNAGAIWYFTVPAGQGLALGSDLLGLLTTARIEQIDIQALATTCVYMWMLHYD